MSQVTATAKAPSKRSMAFLLKRILREIIAQRKWALLPVWMLLAAIFIVFLLSSGSYLLPAIYIAF